MKNKTGVPGFVYLPVRFIRLRFYQSYSEREDVGDCCIRCLMNVIEVITDIISKKKLYKVINKI